MNRKNLFFSVAACSVFLAGTACGMEEEDKKTKNFRVGKHLHIKIDKKAIKKVENTVKGVGKTSEEIGKGIIEKTVSKVEEVKEKVKSELETYKLPNDFVAEIYGKLNIDLESYWEKNKKNEVTLDEFLKGHYISNGFSEKRSYKVVLPEDFLPEVYGELHKDLTEHYNGNLDLQNQTTLNEFLKSHYINNGFWEKRLYKKN